MILQKDTSMSFTEAVTGSKLKRNRWYLDTIQATAHSMFFSWLSKLSHLCNLHKHLKIANARSNFQQIKNRRRAGLALKRGCFHFLRKELYSNLAERHIDSMQVSPNQSLENKNTNSCVRSRLGEPQHFLCLSQLHSLQLQAHFYGWIENWRTVEFFLWICTHCTIVHSESGDAGETYQSATWGRETYNSCNFQIPPETPAFFY